MSQAQKIFSGIVGFLVLVLFIIMIVPNFKEGGNKSIFSTSNTSQTVSKNDGVSTEKKEEQTPKTVAVPDNPPSFELTFTAFKTPEKVGVNGTFNNIKLNNIHKNANSIAEALTGSNFVIETASVDTHDPTRTRDPKLKDFFFQKLASPQIVGTFNSFENGKANLDISLNGKTKNFTFDYTESGDALNLKGSVDIVKDFSANAALEAITEACKDLHQNKTWSDVAIEVVFKK